MFYSRARSRNQVLVLPSTPCLTTAIDEIQLVNVKIQKVFFFPTLQRAALINYCEANVIKQSISF